MSRTRWPITGMWARLTGAVIALFLLLPRTPYANQAPICAIDMGSNSFRRIVGLFANDRYTQSIETLTLGVGDDLAAHGRISEKKLADIEKALSDFKSSCNRAGASTVMAIGTAAFRDAPNADVVLKLAASLGIPMEVATERRESELAYLAGSLGRDGYAVIDNGSRSIELVTRENATYRYVVFNLGYRVAYEKFFSSATDPMQAYRAFEAALQQEASRGQFMKGKQRLIGVEFGEMVEVLFPPARLEGRILEIGTLRNRLREMTTGGSDRFKVLKLRKNIDRALPRLVVAVSMLEAFGYTQLELTERELGAGLIVEAGVRAAADPSAR